MGKDKLRKFSEIDTFPNVYQLHLGKVMKGKWGADHFKNNKPIVVELACGKGEYAVNLAKLFPEKNFIGVDLKGNRIWRGARTGVDEGIQNLAFLRIQIEDILEFFAVGEIDEIWITFPDPQIKYRRTKHRMTHPDFLERYKKILKKDGIMHLKTDSEFLHGYTLGLLQGLGKEIMFANHDIYGAPEFDPETPLLREIKTYYEGLFESKGKTITYIKFKI